MKLRKVFFAVFLVSMLVVSACGSKESANNSTNQPSTNASESKAQAETPKNNSPENKAITLRLAHVTAEGSHFDFAAKKFKEIVEADTSANITVEIFPNGQLGQEREVLESLQSGVLEMTITGHDPLALFAPMVGALGMPYVFEDADHAFRVVEGPFGDKVRETLLSKNLRLIEFGENGFRVMTNSKHPIEKPEDVKGLQIRSPQAPVNLAITKSLGGIPIAMPFGETYSALQQKLIDGQENALPQIYDSKYYEVQKYLSMTNHLYGFVTMLISEPVFSKLSESQQQLVLSAGKEAMIAQRAYSHDLTMNVLVDKLQEAGMIVNYPDLAPFKEATKDVHKEFLKDFGQETYDMLLNSK